MTWTPEIIKARFIEAADVESRLPGVRNGQGASWPSYVHSFEDMNGWGTQRLAEDREFRIRKIPPTSAAITRYEDVLNWTANLIHDEFKRRLVWAYAICQLNGWSFSEKCRRMGWNRETSYNRLNKIFSCISSSLRNSNDLLRLPDEKWLLQHREIAGINRISSGCFDDEPNKSPKSFIGELSRDMLKTPEDFKRFSKHLRAHNRACRKAKDRKKSKFMESANK